MAKETERPDISGINPLEVLQKAGELRQVLDRLGIEVALFDLDDTLTKTNEVFIKQMREFAEFVVVRVGGHTFEEVWPILEGCNNRAYQTGAVYPNRWRVVTREMETIFGDGLMGEGLAIFMKIYQELPRFHEGAIEVLETFSKAGVRMGLVTHANEAWTKFKLDGLRIRGYFTGILIVDENQFKGPEHWQQAIELFGVSPEQTLVVGDSLPGDIMAADRVGVKHKVWIPSDWVMYRNGQVPEGTVQVECLRDMVDVLIRAEA